MKTGDSYLCLVGNGGMGRMGWLSIMIMDDSQIRHFHSFPRYLLSTSKNCPPENDLAWEYDNPKSIIGKMQQCINDGCIAIYNIIQHRKQAKIPGMILKHLKKWSNWIKLDPCRLHDITIITNEINTIISNINLNIYIYINNNNKLLGSDCCLYHIVKSRKLWTWGLMQGGGLAGIISPWWMGWFKSV